MFLSSFRSSNVAVVWCFSRQLLKLFFFCCRCYCVFPKSFVLIPLHTGTQLSDTVVNSWLAGWRQLANVSEGMQSELGTCLFFLLFLLLFLSLFSSLGRMSSLTYSCCASWRRLLYVVLITNWTDRTYIVLASHCPFPGHSSTVPDDSSQC